MAKRSIARRTLRKARILADLAEQRFSDNDPEAFEACLEAAIQFGRNITFHIQKEYSDQRGFQCWYSAQRARIQADPVCSFFQETRTDIVHKWPIRGLNLIISLRSKTTADYYLRDFDHPKYRDLPALQLLREYLDKLEAIIQDAEVHF